MRRIHISRIILASLMTTLLLAACGKETIVDPNAAVATAMEPTSGAIDSEVIISGNGFGTDPSAIGLTFAGAIGKITSVTPTRITAVVPIDAVSGTVEVTLNGTLIGSFPFGVMMIDPSTGLPGRWRVATADVLVEKISGLEQALINGYRAGTSETDLGMSYSDHDTMNVGLLDTLRIGDLTVVLDTARRIFGMIRYRSGEYSTTQHGGTGATSYGYDTYEMELHDVPYSVEAGTITATLVGEEIGGHLLNIATERARQSSYYDPKYEYVLLKLLPYTPESRIRLVVRPGK